MKTLYEKIEIKSKDDLPKKDEKYYFHTIGDFTLRFCSPYSATFRQLKRRINYYLQPVETKQTAEEILKDELSDNIWYDISTTPVSYGSEVMIKDWIIEAMKRYASQNQQSEISVTDDILEKEFPVYHQNNLMTIVNGHRQEGAKWLRDKLKSNDLNKLK